MTPYEIELKYSLKSPAQGQEILSSDFIESIALSESKKTLSMRAVYYDDSEGSLASHRIGYRVRREQNEYVSTVKWSSPGSNRDGFSKRNEINLPSAGETPEPKKLAQIIEDKEIAELLYNLKPVHRFTTDFIRKLVLVNYAGSVIELAFDEGSIIAGEPQLNPGRQAIEPICELECELKSGDEETLIQFGRELSSRFDIAPFNKSKMKRGLNLLKKI